jgi:hypothetical protein
MLVLLDNAEHLLPALVNEVRWLLQASEGLAVIVTSRERLQLTSEHVFAVPPPWTTRNFVVPETLNFTACAPRPAPVTPARVGPAPIVQAPPGLAAGVTTYVRSDCAPGSVPPPATSR